LKSTIIWQGFCFVLHIYTNQTNDYCLDDDEDIVIENKKWHRCIWWLFVCRVLHNCENRRITVFFFALSEYVGPWRTRTKVFLAFGIFVVAYLIMVGVIFRSEIATGIAAISKWLLFRLVKQFGF
jgi:hypothetical protein